VSIDEPLEIEQCFTRPALLLEQKAKIVQTIILKLGIDLQCASKKERGSLLVVGLKKFIGLKKDAPLLLKGVTLEEEAVRRPGIVLGCGRSDGRRFGYLPMAGDEKEKTDR
jgi:hypothetical protein